MREFPDNSNKEPADVVFDNPTLNIGAYMVPSCPSCGEPTYSEPACPFCRQPFTTEDGSVPEKLCPYCTITKTDNEGKHGEALLKFRLPKTKDMESVYILEFFGRYALTTGGIMLGEIYNCPMCGRRLSDSANRDQSQLLDLVKKLLKSIHDSEIMADIEVSMLVYDIAKFCGGLDAE